VNKKKQKNFVNWSSPIRGRCAPSDKGFLLLFFKKDASAFTSIRISQGHAVSPRIIESFLIERIHVAYDGVVFEVLHPQSGGIMPVAAGVVEIQIGLMIGRLDGITISKPFLDRGVGFALEVRIAQESNSVAIGKIEHVLVPGAAVPLRGVGLGLARQVVAALSNAIHVIVTAWGLARRVGVDHEVTIVRLFPRDIEIDLIVRRNLILRLLLDAVIAAVAGVNVENIIGGVVAGEIPREEIRIGVGNVQLDLLVLILVDIGVGVELQRIIEPASTAGRRNCRCPDRDW